MLTCLEAGKHVLCEKPFAVNQVQAGRMIEKAREKQLFLMEAMWTRFLPAMRKAAELIAGGAIGQVRHITANFGFFAVVDPESRLFAPDLAGGSLLDVGIYPLALCSMVYNKPPDRIQSRLVLGRTASPHEGNRLIGVWRVGHGVLRGLMGGRLRSGIYIVDQL